MAVSLSSAEIGGQGRTIAFVRDITAEVDRRERMALLNWSPTGPTAPSSSPIAI